MCSCNDGINKLTGIWLIVLECCFGRFLNQFKTERHHLASTHSAYNCEANALRTEVGDYGRSASSWMYSVVHVPANCYTFP